jgi:hypothetical protein
LLIPPGYPEAISGAVLKLLRDPVRRLHMGESARVWVCAHYSDERVLRLAVSFYMNLLKPRPLLNPGGTLTPASARHGLAAWLHLREQ